MDAIKNNQEEHREEHGTQIQFIDRSTSIESLIPLKDLTVNSHYKIPTQPDLAGLGEEVLDGCVISQLTKEYSSSDPQTFGIEKLSGSAFSESQQFKEVYCKYAQDTFKDMNQLLENNKRWAALMYISSFLV